MRNGPAYLLPLMHISTMKWKPIPFLFPQIVLNIPLKIIQQTLLMSENHVENINIFW